VAKQRRIPKKPRKKSQGNIPQPVHSEKKTGSTDREIARVSFLYWQNSHECISHWQASESKDLFLAFFRLCSQDWDSIKKSGGKAGRKTGLGCTLIKNPDKRKDGVWPRNLEADADIYEMRVCQKKRIFGARYGSTFYLIWLDKDHALFPSH